MKITLSQKAPWNARLGNPYRTRWALAAGRRFKVSADSLDALWSVEEVDEAGNRLGGPNADFSAWIDGGFVAIVFSLDEARAEIAKEVSR